MPELYPEDQERVKRYVEAEDNDRTPFKPMLLLGIVLVVLALLTAVSYFVALEHGTV